MTIPMPEPFMYGIMEPDGTPYFGELCVSGDKGDLAADISDLNDGNDTGPYKEVALITTTQAEAYADARVREALREVASSVEQHHPKATPRGIAAAIRLIAGTDGLTAPPLPAPATTTEGKS